jgi:hypothetical protein
VLRAYNKQELLQQDPEACFFVHEKAFKKCFVINDEVTTTFDEDYSSDADQALLYLCFRYSYTKGNSVFTGERYHCKLINIIVTQDQQE